MPNSRIAFITNDLARAGAQRVFVDDANALHAAAHDVHVVTLFRSGPLESELATPLTILAAQSTFDISAVIRLRALLKRERISVVVSTLNEANLITRLVALTLNVRVYTREANMAESKAQLYKLTDVLLAWRSHKILAVSDAVRRSLEVYLPFMQGRIVVVRNGVAVPELPPSPVSDRQGILCVASLTGKKDHAVLIRAMKSLPEALTLTLIGEGPKREELSLLTEELSLTDRITFMGQRSKEEISRAYSSHALFVLPSRYEGCPNAVLEAKAHGLPVVAFAVPGMDEVFSEESGVLVKERSPEALAHGIEECARELEAKSKGARVEAEGMTFTHHIERLISVLEL